MHPVMDVFGQQCQHDVVATLKGCENQDCGITKDEEGLAVFTLQSEVPTWLTTCTVHCSKVQTEPEEGALAGGRTVSSAVTQVLAQQKVAVQHRRFKKNSPRGARGAAAKLNGLHPVAGQARPPWRRGSRKRSVSKVQAPKKRISPSSFRGFLQRLCN